MRDPLFIFMLTRNDATVANAAELAREAIAAGARHIGFKDTGAPPVVLKALTDQLRTAGVTTYLEVVSLGAAVELASAELALALGVDVLMGGVRPEVVGRRVEGAGVRYFPFAGRVVGHPSVLAGSPDEIVASACDIAALPGVDGLDLLAYRSVHDGAHIAREVCAAVAKPVVVAGSIDRPDRIAAVRLAGAHAFTVGTAAIDGAFAATAPGLGGQLAAIAAALDGAPQPPAAGV